MSAEGFYRSPQHWKPVTRAPSIPFNVERVVQVERAVLAQAELYRITIICMWLWRAPDVVLRRRLKRWQIRDPQPVLAEAVRRVGERLAR
jgi:hypothetical protein